MSRTPSLGRSDESAVDLSSNPATPADMSPYMNGDVYTLPPIDAMALPQRADTERLLHASLPDILDPNTAASVPIRSVCCIGAGYVGMFCLENVALINTDSVCRRTYCGSHRTT